MRQENVGESPRACWLGDQGCFWVWAEMLAHPQRRRDVKIAPTGATNVTAQTKNGVFSVLALRRPKKGIHSEFGGTVSGCGI